MKPRILCRLLLVNVLVLTGVAEADTLRVALADDDHDTTSLHVPSVHAQEVEGTEHSDAEMNDTATDNRGMSLMMGPLGLPMQRVGSGTAWEPDSTPLRGAMLMPGGWMFMLHYNVFVGYDDQGSARGDRLFASINWLMGMVRHSLLGGQITGRMMLSGEPLTVGIRGYPLLLQSGEAVRGEALHDRQHPHDLFMEIALQYNRAIGDSLAFELYLAPSGEPALGPVAFPHRYSAWSNPFAPLGHHWQDSTHIAFGVITAGLYTKRFKVEGSVFNGREPDEFRYNFDFRALDSFSGRLSLNPIDDLSLQASFGYLKSPEELEPDVSEHRLTASATYNRQLPIGNWATTAVFGRDIFPSGPSTSSLLLESSIEFNRNTAFGRIEFVQKTGRDLALAAAVSDVLFPVGVIELGYSRSLVTVGPAIADVGLVGLLGIVGEGLRPYYDTRLPVGGMVFVRLWPTELKMAGMSH